MMGTSFAVFATLATFLAHNDFPIISTATAGLMAGSLLVIGLLSFVLAQCGRTGIAVGGAIPAYIISAPYVGGLDVPIAIAFGLLAYWKGEKVLNFLSVILGVIAATSFLVPAETIWKDERQDIPTSGPAPLIHIILDEHGPVDEYLEFDVAQARSEHFYTSESLPHVLEDHVARLKAAGYSVETWQNDYIDLCENQCVTYPDTSLAPVQALPLGDQMALISLGVAGLYPRFERPNWHKLSTLNALAAFDRFIQRARNVREGQALIFHALVPHHPYATRSDCSIRSIDEWQGRKGGSLAARQAAYLEQEACVRSLVAQLPDVRIIIHGDHGTRITDRDPPNLRPEDDEAVFRTLFVTKNLCAPSKGTLRELLRNVSLNGSCNAKKAP